MIVKVCGVTDGVVARVAVEAGADWIGLVFVPGSSRHADDAGARAVIEAVAGDADIVGVLVSPEAACCDALALRYGLAAVQVHGSVDPLLVDRCSVPVIRAFNPRSRREAFTMAWWPDALIHVDGAPDDPSALPGGTGRALPRPWAGEIARHRRIMLAGGLSPANVAEAIAEVRPAGVDASSGLESSPGVKDPRLVEQFVLRARAA